MVSRMDKPLTPPHRRTLEAALTAPAQALLRAATTEADARGLQLWAVGGTIRDVAAGDPLADVDLAVDRDALPLAHAVAQALGGIVSGEERFGTASVVAGGERLDLATLRDERYDAPGALPSVTLGATVEADLARRDFSVNALALALAGPRAGELLDPYDGLGDLAARRFEVLHQRSFEDDATRIWRAARLAAHHDLRPTAATRERLIEGTRWLDTVSGDRLWSEFALIAERGRAGRTLGLLDEWGALEATSPALALAEPARTALRRRWRPLPAARLAAVVLATREPPAASAALQRLNAPALVSRAVGDAHALLAGPVAEPERLEALAKTGAEARVAARWLDPRQLGLQRELRRWERTRPHLGAEELLALGVAEGPDLGRLLRCLRRGRYLGTVGTMAEARTLVRRDRERQGDTR